MENAIFNWFLSMWNQNVPLSAAMIQEKALTFAKEFNVKSLQASECWLWRLKERNHITFKIVSSESIFGNPEMVDGC